MRTFAAHSPEAALAQPLTEELLTAAGIARGMRVLVLGRGLTELALLIAERVGDSGSVLGVSADERVVAAAKGRAAEEGFERVAFRAGTLGEAVFDGPVDAVFGRSFLTYEREPLEAIRRAADAVHEGGRVIFQEWHFDSMRWPETSAWPHVSTYRDFATCAIEGLRHRGVHVDMGLRLINLFTEAGLAIPMVRTELRAIHGSDAFGYGFFEALLRESRARDAEVAGFAERLRHETAAAGGHLFLPLQVGTWTRVAGDRLPLRERGEGASKETSWIVRG